MPGGAGDTDESTSNGVRSVARSHAPLQIVGTRGQPGQRQPPHLGLGDHRVPAIELLLAQRPASRRAVSPRQPPSAPPGRAPLPPHASKTPPVSHLPLLPHNLLPAPPRHPLPPPYHPLSYLAP